MTAGEVFFVAAALARPVWPGQLRGPGQPAADGGIKSAPESIARLQIFLYDEYSFLTP